MFYVWWTHWSAVFNWLVVIGTAFVGSSGGGISSISFSFSAFVWYTPFGTIVVENAILDIYALRKFFSLLKKKGLVIILFSKSPEKWTFTSRAAYKSDGCKSGSWVQASRGELVAQ